MRKILAGAMFAAAGPLQACSWPRGTEGPIPGNVRFATGCLAMLVGMIVASTLIFIRFRRSYWVPISVLPLAILTWLARGTAYQGDCGITAVMTALLSTITGFIFFGIQLLLVKRTT